ncbi:DDE-type integrase/transposase/recombinase [Actinopolymorpha sp. B11F2]|uniref:integrase core domain-containing protein n=1 Tax=Actinopolymorpha sp. B11F2 TaxID=3160862 RepID=UPI0032E41848
MIREDAAMPVSRFAALIGIPRRTYHRRLARHRHGEPVKGPWPSPQVERIEPVAAKYAGHWPAWGHRKIHALMAVDGHLASTSTVERAMRRRGLLQPIGYTGERRELAKARKAAFAEPPTRPNQVWQLDFSEYETTTAGTWRLAGVTDYFAKYEHGWHISPTCTGTDAIAAVEIAIAEAERLGGKPLVQLLPVNPETGRPVRIKLVTDNGAAFKGAAFARFIASQPELVHIRTRGRSPGQNGVRERAFGSLKYEHLYRLADQIATLDDLCREADTYLRIFNQIRPHEALAFHRPIEVYHDPSLHPIHNIQSKDLVPEA